MAEIITKSIWHRKWQQGKDGAEFFKIQSISNSLYRKEKFSTVRTFWDDMHRYDKNSKKLLSMINYYDLKKTKIALFGIDSVEAEKLNINDFRQHISKNVPSSDCIIYRTTDLISEFPTETNVKIKMILENLENKGFILDDKIDIYRDDIPETFFFCETERERDKILQKMQYKGMISIQKEEAGNGPILLLGFRLLIDLDESLKDLTCNTFAFF